MPIEQLCDIAFLFLRGAYHKSPVRAAVDYPPWPSTRTREKTSRKQNKIGDVGTVWQESNLLNRNFQFGPLCRALSRRHRLPGCEIHIYTDGGPRSKVSWCSSNWKSGCKWIGTVRDSSSPPSRLEGRVCPSHTSRHGEGLLRRLLDVREPGLRSANGELSSENTAIYGAFCCSR